MSNFPTSPWEFNTLNIYNFNKDGPYSGVFEYLKNNESNLFGEVLEAGSFKGRMTLALGIFLNIIKSSKKVYAFDTFEGFPSYSKYDHIDYFWSLFKSGEITNDHFNKVKKLISIKNAVQIENLTPANISSSGNFAHSELNVLKLKIDFLNLQNIQLVIGDFKNTMKPENFIEKSWSLVFLDCDLFSGYKQTLEYAWPNLSIGGMVFLDEYFSIKFPGPRRAVNDFFKGRSDYKFVNLATKNDDFERWSVIKIK